MLLCVWTWNERKRLAVFIQKQQNISFIFYVIISCALFTSLLILPTQDAPLALYQSLKLLEYILLGLYITTSKIKLKNLILPIALSIVFESSIALSQWIRQTSIGGWIYWFGERSFYASTPGIALVDIKGSLYLRPYGTLPHPNVLGGFLALSLTAITFVIVSVTSQAKSKKKGITLLVIGTCYVLGILALCITFSLSAVVSYATGIALIGLYVWKNKEFSKKLKYIFLGFFIVAVCITSAVAWTKLTSLQTAKDVQIRVNLNSIALQMFVEKPINGSGINSFIPNLQKYKTTESSLRSIQPVHNIYLLILAETGLIGVTIFMYVIFKCFQEYFNKENMWSKKWIGFVLLSQLLIIGMVDHYFLTLQQGQLMTVLVISLAFLPKTSYT